MQIFHGDNQVASRQNFLSKKELIKKQFNIVDLPGDNITLNDLKITLNTSSLFGNPNAVFIEGFFSRRPSAEKKAIVEYIKANPNINVFFWDSKDVSTQLSILDSQLSIKFDLPKYIFQFIDNWTISALRQALSTSEPEQILALLAKRLHDLILIKENRGKFPSWQTSKLAPQAKKYTNLQLTTYNAQLLGIDFAQKTGQTALDLGAALELWLTKNVK